MVRCQSPNAEPCIIGKPVYNVSEGGYNEKDTVPQGDAYKNAGPH
jgi:hypothetical protein